MTILEAAKQARASRTLQEKVASRADMKVLTETTVQEFRGNGRLRSIVMKDLATGRTRETPAGGVFLYIGLSPNTGFLEGVVELDQHGFVVTQPNLETSMPGVFAAGDCRKGSTKQVASAAGEGATAALMVREYLERRGERVHPQPEPAGAAS